MSAILTFLVGATPSIAQANLQTLVTTILKQENVEVASAGGLPIEDNGRLHVIGVRLSLQGSLAAVHAAIQQIENTTPPLIIREATIRNVTPIQSSVLTRPIELSAELAVYGSLSPAISLNEGVPK